MACSTDGETGAQVELRVYVVDIRPRVAFNTFRLPGAVWMLPKEVPSRLFELPPKGTALVLAVPPSDSSSSVVPSTPAAARGEEKTPPVAQGDDAAASDDDEGQRLCSLLVAAGWPTVIRVVCPTDLDVVMGPPSAIPARLWRPADLVEAVVPSVVEPALCGAGIALDVGCGSGRDAAFLASRGWHVLGIENRRKLAQQARGLAGRSIATSHATGAPTAAMHEPFLQQLDDGIAVRPASVDLLVLVRFLHRPLLSRLTRYVRPGGFVLYSHFVDGVQLVGTPKNPAAYLMHGELLEVFGGGGDGKSDLGFEVVLHRETTLADGRPIVEFVARKKKPRGSLDATRAAPVAG